MNNTTKNSVKNYHNPSLQQLVERLAPTLDEIKTTACSDASVLVAITNEAQPQVLLTRRSSTMKHHAGQVSFAGGRHESQDKTNLDTALREAQEETALDPHSVQIIGQLSQQKSKAGLWVQPIVAIIPPTPSLIAQESEIDRIFWVALEDFINHPLQEYQFDLDTFGKIITIATPSWQLNNEIIWGLTGRIIANLLQMAFDKNINWYYKPVT